MMHPDLLTRSETALLLGVSVSRLAKGWGPAPLPDYRRPRMYSRSTVELWLTEQRTAAACCTSEVTSGEPSSSSTASATVSPRVRAIIEQQRKKRAAYESRSNSAAVSSDEPVDRVA